MKRKSIGLMVGMTILFLTGCGLSTSISPSYEADTSTVFVLKKGGVVTTDVEPFALDTYQEKDLQAYVEDAISDFCAQNGEDVVKLQSLKVNDGEAALTIDYDSEETYSSFTGNNLFVGTVTEAQSAGFSFEDSFISTKDETVCSAQDVLSADKEQKVVIFDADGRIQVDGEILYYSKKNNVLIDKHTLEIREEASDETDETIEGTELTEEEIEELENAGLVSEDELLTGEESADIEFDFSEEEEEEISIPKEKVYNYIIYK